MKFPSAFAINFMMGFLLLTVGRMVASAQSLELTIQFDKSMFLLGEPIVAYVSLKNISTTPQPILDKFDPQFLIFKYYIQQGEGEEKLFRPWALAEGDFPERTLQPGELVAGTAKIFFGADGWTFATPGQYAVHVAYRPDVISAAAHFSVQSPASEAEKQQADLILGDNESGYFLLFESGDHLKNGIRRLEELITRYPDSPLAAYANYALGMSLSRDFADFTQNLLRRADYGKALSYLDRSKDRLSELSTLYFTASAYDRLAETYVHLGRPEQADRTRGQLEELLGREFSILRPITPMLMRSLRTAPR